MPRRFIALLLLFAGASIGAASVARATRCAPPTTVAFLELESALVDGAPLEVDPPDESEGRAVEQRYRIIAVDYGLD